MFKYDVELAAFWSTPMNFYGGHEAQGMALDLDAPLPYGGVINTQQDQRHPKPSLFWVETVYVQNSFRLGDGEDQEQCVLII